MGGRQDTIVALATPPGKAALALIRLSGDRSIPLLQRCVGEAERFNQQSPRMVGLFVLCDPADNAPIDQVMVIKYGAPYSYTGEDMAEVMCHGGPAVVERIMELLCRVGARISYPGEFTRRAYLNGKVDLVRAEAIRELSESESEISRAEALSHLVGHHCTTIQQWRKDLIETLSEIEARLDFPDEDDTRESGEAIISRIRSVKASIAQELALSRQGQMGDRGIVSVLWGPRNAGKSTLFNLLLRTPRSIVHHTPGTTRDVISERLDLGKVSITLADTAGDEWTQDEIEGMGIERGRLWARESDFLIWVTPADRPFTAEEQSQSPLWSDRTIGVISGTDRGTTGMKELLFETRGIAFCTGSLVEESGQNRIRDYVLSTLTARIQGVFRTGAFRTIRQRDLGNRILQSLAEIEDGSPEEICAQHLRETIAHFDELIGVDTTEEVLDSIFSRFCIGK